MDSFALLPAFHSCFFCGDRNPHGFRIRYSVDPATGFVVGAVEPEAHHCGFPGVLHGGLQGALLDDVMWWAVSFARGTSAVTAEQTTRFFAPAALPGRFTLKAEGLGGERRKYRARGWIEDGAGKVVSEAEALYLLHSRAYFEEMFLPAIDFSGCPKEVRERYEKGAAAQD